MERFPFIIHYLDMPDRIWIVAFAHTSRKADYWKRRIPWAGQEGACAVIRKSFVFVFRGMWEGPWNHRGTEAAPTFDLVQAIIHIFW
jgi:hypothetical protein